MHCLSTLHPPGGRARGSQPCVGRTLVALLLVSPLILSSCTGCGVTVHNEVAYRASQLLAISPASSASWPVPPGPHSINLALSGTLNQEVLSSSAIQGNAPPSTPSARPLDQFRDMILEKKELLLPGSFFPDWGYSCIGKLWNNAAERAHWPPFIEAAINHIVDTYPQPWADDHVKDLIVFLFGVVSHEAADVLWHSLEGLAGGFISALAKTSFEDDYGKAHTLADVGAEFVLSHMSDMDHLATTWKVPIRDLTQIYRRLDHRVPGPILSHCMRNGYAVSQANSRLGGKLFPVYASKSPFLVEQLEDYPIGGLRDMTAWTIDCWQGLARHLSESFTALKDPLGHRHHQHRQSFKLCEVFHDPAQDSSRHRREGTSKPHRHLPSGTAAISQLRESGYTLHTKEDEKTGMVTFSIERIFQDTTSPNEERSTDTQDEPDEASNEATGGAVPSRAKENKVHMTGDAVCAALSDEAESLTQVLYLPLPYSSFGHAVTTGDFDGDGEPDIVIGAPHATFDSHVPSQGAVYVVPGSKVAQQHQQQQQQQQQQRLNNTSGQTTSPLPALDVRTIASAVIFGNASEPQGRFGWSLATVDLNEDGIDDLAIGAPGEGSLDLEYSGAIYVFFGRKNVGLQEVRLEQADLIIRHKTPGTFQQQQPDVTKSCSNLRGWNADGTRARKGLPPQAMRHVDPLAGLGTRLRGIDLSGDGFKDLIVQSPLANVVVHQPPSEGVPEQTFTVPQGGKVAVFLASSRHVGPLVTDADRDWEIVGHEPYGWFGSSLAVYQDDRVDPIQNPKDRRTVMAVGSPAFGLAGQQEEKVMVGQVQGFVIPTEFHDTLSKRTTTQPNRIFTIQGDRKFQQFGSRLETLYVLQKKTTNAGVESVLRPVLVAGSHSEETEGFLPVGKLWQAGVVRVLNLSMIPDGTETTTGELEKQSERQEGDDDDDDEKREAVILATLVGSQSLAHLSAAMAVSSPSKTASYKNAASKDGIWLTEPLAKAEAGRVLKWEPELGQEGGDSNKGDDDDNDDPEPIPPPSDGISQCYLGSEFRGRFGAMVLVEDVNMDGAEDLIVTSAHSSTFAIHSGTVSVRFRD